MRFLVATRSLHFHCSAEKGPTRKEIFTQKYCAANSDMEFGAAGCIVALWACAGRGGPGGRKGGFL